VAGFAASDNEILTTYAANPTLSIAVYLLSQARVARLRIVLFVLWEQRPNFGAFFTLQLYLTEHVSPKLNGLTHI
jgi:hypothetical protein